MFILKVSLAGVCQAGGNVLCKVFSKVLGYWILFHQLTDMAYSSHIFTSVRTHL